MKRFSLVLLIITLLAILPGFSQFYHFSPRVTKTGKGIVNTKADNMGYWMDML